MDELSRLELERPGGGGRTGRSFFDFVVDGRSLFDLLGPDAGDTCGSLGWGDPTWQEQTVRRLRLDDSLLLDGEREPLYVCPECGDLECGAVTVRITASKGIVRWADFVFDGSSASEHRQPIPGIGPFAFEFHAYRHALTAALDSST